MPPDTIESHNEETLVRGAQNAARALRVRIGRETLLGIIRSSTDLQDCAGRLADALKAAARARRVDISDKILDP
jgi:hypothetical protein